MHIAFIILSISLICSPLIASSQPAAAAAAGAGAGSSHSTKLIDDHFEMIVAKPNHQFTPQDKKNLLDQAATFALDKKSTSPHKAKMLFDQAVAFQKKLESTYTDLNEENSRWFNEQILQPLATNIRHLRRIAGAASPKSAALLNDETKRKKIMLKADQISAQAILLKNQVLKRYRHAEAAIADLSGKLGKEEADLDTLNVSQTNSDEEIVTKKKALEAVKALREKENQEAQARLEEAQKVAELSRLKLDEATTEYLKLEATQREQLIIYTAKKLAFEKKISTIKSELTSAQSIKKELIEAGSKVGAQNLSLPNENNTAINNQTINNEACCLQ
jgi:hypothetical protein